MTLKTPQQSSPSASKEALPPDSVVEVRGREYQVGTRRKTRPAKKRGHIPGHPLDISLKVSSSTTTAPYGFSIKVLPSSYSGYSIFTPSLDNHLGIFCNDSEPEVLEELIENFVCDEDARGGARIWQAPARIVDCTPNGKFSQHKFRERVVSNSYYAHLPGAEQKVLQHLDKAISEMRRRCRQLGAVAPPNRGYDLMMLWLEPTQAERLAVEHGELLERVISSAGLMHVPIIFLVEGEATHADSFIRSLNRAMFLGEENKAYILEMMTQVQQDLDGSQLRVVDTSSHRYPVGFEPVWIEERQRFVMSSLFTYRHHGASLRAEFEKDAVEHNRQVWDDFLASINPGL